MRGIEVRDSIWKLILSLPFLNLVIKLLLSGLVFQSQVYFILFSKSDPRSSTYTREKQEVYHFLFYLTHFQTSAVQQ